MADDSDFLSRLMSFGLSEKEAQTYLHLLKYGPKPPTLLAKSLKTYREDVHRTLSSLIDKGVVNPSLDSPTVYSAVELETALDVALKRHETGLRDMEVKKLELMELSQQNRFRPSDEFTSYKILKNFKEATVVMQSLMSSMDEEIICVFPEIIFVTSSLFGLNEEIKRFIDRGGTYKIISDISYPTIELVQENLDMGIDVRHLEGYKGLIFTVFDRKIALSAINADIRRATLDEPASGLWADDPAYANYLVSTFELLWAQAIPVAQRIEQLLKEGPPQAWPMNLLRHLALLMEGAIADADLEQSINCSQ